MLIQATDRPAVQQRHRVIGSPGVNVVEAPAEQAAIKAFRGGQIRRHQIHPDYFAGVALAAGGLHQRRQHEARSAGDRHQGDAHQRTEAPSRQNAVFIPISLIMLCIPPAPWHFPKLTPGHRASGSPLADMKR